MCCTQECQTAEARHIFRSDQDQNTRTGNRVHSRPPRRLLPQRAGPLRRLLRNGRLPDWRGTPGRAGCLAAGRCRSRTGRKGVTRLIFGIQDTCNALWHLDVCLRIGSARRRHRVPSCVILSPTVITRCQDARRQGSSLRPGPTRKRSPLQIQRPRLRGAVAPWQSRD